ncbi:MAG: thermonuclease family protein [Phycisphaerales bacterium]|nr:thermonuclease family protein [Phycisphaerales bacterium]
MRLCRVVGVVDGDTVLLDFDGTATRFELLAINAPEYIERDPSPRAHARESWFALKSLVGGEWVYVHRDPAVLEDAAGRATGFLFRSPDMLLVNLEMVRQGHAEHQPKRSVMFADSLSWWQRHAVEAEKGIWGDEPGVLVDPAPEVPVPEPMPELLPVPKVVPTAIAPTPERTVFLTKSGSKYHTKDCRYYSPGCTEVPISEARKEHEPCKVCKPDQPGG